MAHLDKWTLSWVWVQKHQTNNQTNKQSTDRKIMSIELSVGLRTAKTEQEIPNLLLTFFPLQSMLQMEEKWRGVSWSNRRDFKPAGVIKLIGKQRNFFCGKKQKCYSLTILLSWLLWRLTLSSIWIRVKMCVCEFVCLNNDIVTF